MKSSLAAGTGASLALALLVVGCATSPYSMAYLPEKCLEPYDPADSYYAECESHATTGTYYAALGYYSMPSSYYSGLDLIIIKGKVLGR